jgi:hypothetical protein
MAILHSKYVHGAFRVPTPSAAGEVVAIRYEYDYTGDESDGDILDLGILPANTTVLDMVADVDDVDGGSDFEFDVGLMNGNVGDTFGPDGTTPRTCGAEFFDGATIGQDAGIARMTVETGFRVAKVGYDRSIGVKFVDQGTTDGTFGLTVFYGS